MADECDIASESTQRLLDAALQGRRMNAQQRIAAAPGGLCANECGERAISGAACCSKECMEDLELRARFLTRNSSRS